MTAARRTRARQCGLAIAFVMAAGCAGTPKLQTAIGPDAGEPPEQVYRRACASCHGADGTGHGPQAPTLRVPPTDLTRLAARAGGTFPRDQVIGAITGVRDIPDHGTRDMPAWGERFEPVGHGATAVASLYARRRTEALADYVATLQRR